LKKEFLRQKRKELLLSQKQLALKLKVSESTIRNWESGRVPVPEWVKVNLYLVLLIENVKSKKGIK
tara:strand:+ start:171 stop:368 length:198 start_codon:yes stop_codon:yes gene_type:complete